MVRLMSTFLLSTLHFILQIETAATSYCGTGAVPYRLEVLTSGALSLGCAEPSCFGGGKGGAGVHQHKSSEFFSNNKVSNGQDGFIRKGDAERSHFRHPNAPAQRAVCEEITGSLSCSGQNQWIGGIFQATGGKRLRLRCCTYSGLSQSTLIENLQLNEKEAYVGGEVLENGRQTAFDVVTNVRRVIGANGKVGYKVTVSRMPCLPELSEIENQLEPGTEESIDSLLFQPADSAAGDSAGGAAGDGAGGAAGDGAGGAAGDGAGGAAGDGAGGAAGEGFGAAGGVGALGAGLGGGVGAGLGAGAGACFSADTLLTTKLGEKRMDKLRIGDEILSTGGFGWQETFFVPVVSFLHRMPHSRTKFLRIEATDGSIIKITPLHFIMIGSEDENIPGKYVLAQDVKLGDRFLRAVGNSEFLPVTVMNVTVVEEIGAYAPMTSNGEIVVNNLIASCHSVSRTHSLQYTFFHYMRKLESLLWPLFATETADQGDGFVDVPIGTWKILSVFDYIIPSVRSTTEL